MLIVLLLKVAEIVAVSSVLEEVSVAVYVPSPLSVTLDIVPAVVLITTVSPPDEILFPLTSLS